MIKLASKEKCTGCAACYNACGRNAISMTADGEGFLFPVINEKQCVECGHCIKSCPILEERQNENAEKPKAFAVWSDADRTVSSSGGAFSAFARLILEKQGLVFGAAFDEKLQCQHKAVDNVDGLEPLRGSKYVQSFIGDTFKQVKEALRKDRFVLYCGTPCQIAGLKNYLRKNHDNLLLVDLACHGVPSQAVFDAYIAKISTRFAGRGIVDGFEFRRRDGWGSAPSVSLGGKFRSLFGKDNLYMTAFDKSMTFRRSCYSCPFAQLPRVGDITLADFWGLGRHGKPFKHDVMKGVSLVLVNNEKGERFMTKLGDGVFVEERTLDEALIENHNIQHPSTLNPQRINVIKAFLSGMSLDEIDAQYHVVDRSVKGMAKDIATKWHLFTLVKYVYNLVLTKVNRGGVIETFDDSTSILLSGVQSMQMAA